MAEDLTFFKEGERFATVTEKGSVHVWEVDSTGLPVNADNRPPHTHKEQDVLAEVWDEGFTEAERHIERDTPIRNPYRS